MHLLLIPGNSPLNKSWLKKVEKTLTSLFKSTHIQYYKHWSTGTETINKAVEFKKLISEAEKHADYTIFAKSIGVTLTLEAISQDKIWPKKS